MSSVYKGLANPFAIKTKAEPGQEPDLMISETANQNGFDAASFLEGLAELAVRPFSTSHDAIRAILEHAATHLHLRTAFLTQLAPDSGRLRVVAAYNMPGGCGITAGAALPAQPPFAERTGRVMSSAPLMINDLRAEPGLSALLAEVPGIRSYIGVPIMLSGAHFFGTICVADPQPHALNVEQAGLLAVLARIAAGHVETDNAVMSQRRAEDALAMAQAAQSKHVRGKTAELLAERARLEERWQALMAGSPDGILVTDTRQNIQLCNEQFALLTGATNAEDLIGKNVFDFIAPEDRSLASINLQRAFELGTVKCAEYSILRRDESRARAEVSVAVSSDIVGQSSGFVYTIHDITTRLRSEEKLNKHFDRLAALRNIDMAITVSHDLKLTLNVILYQAIAQLRVDAVSVLLLNHDTQMLEYSAGRGFRSDTIGKTPVALGEGYAGRAALERRVLAVPNINEAPEFQPAWRQSSENFVAYYALPLQAKDQIEGVLEIFHRSPLNPDLEWLDFMEALSGQAAIAIDNAKMFEDLQHSNIELALAYDTTLEGWSRALDLRDRETEGHTRRVTEQAIKLARRLGVGEADLVHLRRGALLHDIGKMGIPDGILLKPGPLNDAEWSIMRRHPQYAYDMLAPIAFLSQALDIPYCHHEKWDGRGYPRGLKEQEIPLSARIFAVVDVWDALRSTREYHAPWPEERVLDHIKSLSGSHFDPEIVRAFLAMRAEGDNA